jgi:flavin reductase (DIM6/NTAB) family NADH-FMN oxidoreductase RutF
MSSNPPQDLFGAVDAREFRRACAQFATGVGIASVLDGAGEARGLTVNSFTSVSLVPPLVLICIGHSAAVLEHFRACAHFGISMLGEEQEAVSLRFAEHDRFEEVPWCAGRTGVPLIPNALAAMELRLVRTLTVGDHDIFIGQVVRTTVRGGNPLIYYGSAYRRLDHVSEPHP